MSHSRVGAVGWRAALVGALLAMAGHADAAIYRGVWDPGYGAPFDDLGWKGFATLQLPDSCLNTVGACTDPGMSVVDATVEFYNINDPSQTVLQTLEFDTNVTIYSMTVNGTELTGVDTGFFLPVQGTIPIAQYNGNDYYFQLVFHGAAAQLFYTNTPTITPACASGGFGGPVLGVCGYSANIPDVVYQPVPEPASLALMLGGLAGVAGVTAVRRRRD
ncbi:MAG: PEP-CTERM sorting domain-containing protein [Proteobacteria bacterium]|nr:PEP-CTERM sorting domain-containing protein [Pseudomonadota bacterium]